MTETPKGMANRVARVLGAMLAAATVMAGCAQVEPAFTSASSWLGDLFRGETAERRLPPATYIDGLYEGAIALRDEGREVEAVRRFRRAAQLGHAGAAYELGVAYDQGRGLEQDREAGARWINVAAERGHAQAQFLVGAVHYGGIGVEQDYERAATYLKAAAVQGVAGAQHLLGEAYRHGRGVPRDAAAAARWYGKAALQGHAAAQYAYGLALAQGRGVPRDQVLAYTYLQLAAAEGHRLARARRDALATRLSAAELERAQSRAAGFTPRAPEGFADPPTVMYVQQALAARGYDAGPVDGIVGPRTRAAIRAYQAEAGLAVDGAVSPVLIEALLTPPERES